MPAERSYVPSGWGADDMMRPSSWALHTETCSHCEVDLIGDVLKVCMACGVTLEDEDES